MRPFRWMAAPQRVPSSETINLQSHMFVNFSIKSVETEAAEKVASMIDYSDKSEQDLFDLCKTKLNSTALAEVNRTLSYARSLSSTNPDHPSMSIYLNHPIRVARLSLQLLGSPDVKIVTSGLLHNVFEVSGVSEQDLIERGYDEQLARGIRLLTIDRNKQYDAEYLAGFYRRIEEFGEELVLIKSVDRLDNLLAFQLIERTPRIERYIELSEQFVTPMTERLSPELGQYHREVVTYLRLVGCDSRLKARYDSFLARAAHS